MLRDEENVQPAMQLDYARADMTPQAIASIGVSRALACAKKNGSVDCQPVLDILNRWAAIAGGIPGRPNS